jgi:hypothetical protein
MLRQRAVQMDDYEWLQPGTRVRLSALGRKRCPKMTRQTGVVVALLDRSDAVRVLMDGNKDPSTLHRSYIEPE